MAYNVQLSNGTALISGGLPDGTIDTTNTSLTLVGKNYPGYGVFLNQNFVQLLENFAKPSAPNAPLPGQLWWDTSNKYLKINVATLKGAANAVWKNLNTITSSSSYTGTPVLGEQWWDTSSSQLKVWSGSTWITIGPAATSSTGNTGAVPDTIAGVSPAGIYVVLKFYIDNTLVGIWSKQTSFTTNLTDTFPVINRGLNLRIGAEAHALYGSVDTANNLNINGVSIPATSFLRNDQSGSINGYLTLTNDTGIKFGQDGDFEGFVTGKDVYLQNTTGNGDIVIRVKRGATQSNIMRFNAVTGIPELYADPTSLSSGYAIATKNYVDTILGSGGTGTTVFNASLVPSANLTYNLGSSSVWWNNIYGTAIHAKYADLAERFETDQPYAPGTVVELGGPAEITAASTDLSESVFGVISTKAAYLMNSSAGDDVTHPPVAVQGRVPVRVIGKIKKGDRLVAAGNGLARAGARNEISPWNVIGRSLENKNDLGEGTVEAIVKLNS